MANEDIAVLEKYIGFPIKRPEVTLESGRPYDESFAYRLCQQFYGNPDALTQAIRTTTKVLLTREVDRKQRELLFAVLGNMYYLQGDFDRSIGCFLKSLTLNKIDLTNLIELAFALRASGRTALFEDIMFNLEVIGMLLRQESKEINKDKIVEIIEKIKKS
jgi:tetratricopeptide (TPR) repeat protein